MDLIVQSFQRIFSGRISPQLWLISILANVVGVSALNIMDRDIFAKPAPLLYGGLVAVFIAILVFLCVTLWKLIRALGDATDDDWGSIGPWIGWAILAYLPVSLIYGLLEHFYEISSNWWLSSIIFSVGMSLTVPLLVHADGKAVQTAGPSVSDILRYWSKNYVRLIASYLAISLPILAAADGLQVIVTANIATAIGLSIASATMTFVSTLICTGITVSAYREGETATKR